MKRREFLFYLFGILSVLLLASFWHVDAANGIGKYTTVSHSLAKDSAFLMTYSNLLGIPLDTTCNPAMIMAVSDWLGTPYRHAGYSRSGVDCSGFVSHIYSDVYGIELTHSSSAMIYQMKERVKKSDLKQGDILFFKIHGKRISHVALYIGNQKFIHASPERGIVVDDLRQPYYQRSYYTAGRVICN
jgi:hypothetical protein